MEDAALQTPVADTKTPVASEPTGSRRLQIIVVLGALIALGPLTIDMYLPALPSIGADLGTPASTVQLTLTGTLLGLGLGQLFIGPLSDVAGRRLPLILGTALHVVASLACLIAPNIAVLGALRVMQGVGCAAAMVVALAVVGDLFRGRSAATVLSRLFLVMGIAPILAPTLGGAVLLSTSWRGVFGVLAGLGVVLLAVAVLALPESLPPARRRSAHFKPILRTYGKLLSDGQFVLLLVVAALAMSALFSYISGSSFVLQEQFGLDQQTFALVFGAGAVSLIGASQLNVLLLRRFTSPQIVLAALVAATASAVLLTVLSVTATGGLLGFVLPLWAVLGSMGFVMPNAPALALNRHGEAAGTASALLGACQFGLGALIAPLVGVLGNDATAMAIIMTAGAAVALLALGAVLRLGNRTVAAV